MNRIEMMDGRLVVHKRPRSRFWQCYTCINGLRWRESTKEENPSLAREFAKDWYLTLIGKQRVGMLTRGKTFRAAAEKFRQEYAVLGGGDLSPEYTARLELKLDKYLIPYFGNKIVTDIGPGDWQAYRIHRANNGYRGKPPGRETMAHEKSAFLQVMKTAQREKWLDFLPDFSDPFKKSKKVDHRAWFTPQEYRRLYLATRERAKNPKKEIWRWQSEQLHDYVLFMGNTGLRPDEAENLEYRDVKIVKDADTEQVILVIEVRGKTGIGICKSMPGAVTPFQRLKKRNNPGPTDKLFPKNHRALFNNVLDELKLKTDRDGRRRTAYSLRHSYISFRLMEGANHLQIANNCRTSVDMIEKFYAIHLRNRVNAADINVRRPKPAKRIVDSPD
jgi:integrase